MAVLKNRAKMSTSSTGTGTITLGSAETGYQSFADAGVANSDQVRYVIEDGNDWEIGTGTYTSSGTTLSRIVSESSNSGSALNLSGSATVFITAAAEDLPNLYADNPVSAVAPTASGNNAVAIGEESTASGTGSISLGSKSDATQTESTALGYFAQATGSSATALGNRSNASNSHAIAIGLNTDATSISSLAIGYAAQATTNTGATAIGDSSVSTGTRTFAFPKSHAAGWDSISGAILNNTSSYGTTSEGNIAFGEKAKVTGSASQGIGKLSITSGDNSMALGYSATASGLRSYVLGYGSTAGHTDSVSIGKSVSTSASNQVSLGGSTQQVRISESYTLPTADGSANQVLQTDGSGALSFATASGGGGGDPDLYRDNASSETTPVASGTNAFAIGTNTTASNTSTIAIGADAVASGYQAQAIGNQTDATATNSSAFGNGSQATASNATAVGGATASASYSTAIGKNSGNNGSVATANAAAMALGGSYASGTDSLAAAIAGNGSSYGATGTSSVSLGKLAKATGGYATAIGESTQAQGNNSVCLGYYSQSQGQGTMVMGYDAQSTAVHCTAIGTNTRNAIDGTFKFSGGKHSAAGDAQVGIYPVLCETTDATATTFVTYHSNTITPQTDNQIVLPNNSAYAFSGTIVARQKASEGTACAAWKIEGLIRREGSAGTTVLVNSAKTVLDNTPSWDVTLSADTTNGCLKIQGTGAASTNIRWSSTITSSELTYA